MKRVAVAMTAVAMTALLGSAPAQAAAPASSLEAQVAAQLAKAPGGVRTAVNELTYDGGAFVVTFAMPGTAKAVQGVPDCPAGEFCFYDGANYTYPRGRLWACGWQDLAGYGWSDRVESVDNSTGNTVHYINHYDAGDPDYGHDLDYVLWTNFEYAFMPTVSDPNRADHVWRVC
jgi:hypothetical protein